MENKAYTFGIINDQNSVPKGKVEIPSAKSLGLYFFAKNMPNHSQLRETGKPLEQCRVSKLVDNDSL